MIKRDRNRGTSRCCQGVPARLSDWDPVRGLHHGQPSHALRKQAGQMTANLPNWRTTALGVRRCYTTKRCGRVRGNVGMSVDQATLPGQSLLEGVPNAECRGALNPPLLMGLRNLLPKRMQSCKPDRLGRAVWPSHVLRWPSLCLLLCRRWLPAPILPHPMWTGTVATCAAVILASPIFFSYQQDRAGALFS